MKPAPSPGNRVSGATTGAKRGESLACVADGNFPVNTVNNKKNLASAT